MTHSILISGFGGQGLMRLGKMLAEAGLREDKHVSWFPSYGAEMRGGTAHCYVKISDRTIASPLVDCPDIAIILNQPSLEKFQKKIAKANLVIVNTDLVCPIASKDKKRYMQIALNTAALTCGDSKVINSVVLGILIARERLFRPQTVVDVLKATFTAPQMQEININAFYYGQKLC